MYFSIAASFRAAIGMWQQIGRPYTLSARSLASRSMSPVAMFSQSWMDVVEHRQAVDVAIKPLVLAHIAAHGFQEPKHRLGRSGLGDHLQTSLSYLLKRNFVTGRSWLRRTISSLLVAPPSGNNFKLFRSHRHVLPALVEINIVRPSALAWSKRPHENAGWQHCCLPNKNRFLTPQSRQHLGQPGH